MATYTRLSDTISVSNTNSNIFLVNGEWTFILPDELYYELDSEFDGGISGGIDLSGSIKPMVIKGLYNGSKHLFNFALQEHYDFFGKGNTIVDCKYDNRFADSDPASAAQKIIMDEEDLYVDIAAENIWPLGIQVQLRARSPKMTPFDFYAVINCGRGDYDQVIDKLKELAYSIRLSKLESESENVHRTAKTANSAQTANNCIIENGVLVKYIGSETDIVLPSGIDKLSDGLFSGRKIRSIVIPEGVHTIGRRAFENCFELENVSLPSTLEELGEYAFVDCHKLKSIDLGDELISIENSVFSECFELRNVIIPRNVERIEAFAFKNCRKFTSIVIPDGVESISFQTFANCKNLSYLYIPASVEKFSEDFLGNTPFVGCDMLTVYCPSGSSAEEYCFAHGISCCAAEEPELQESDYDFSDEEYEPFSGSNYQSFSCSKEATYNDDEGNINDCEIDESGTLTYYGGEAERIILPKGVSAIGEDVFLYNSDIKSVVVPEGVETLGKSAFWGCENLQSITLPSTIREIGKRAFYETGLTSIAIPEGCIIIGDDCFAGCKNLQSVTLPSTIREIGSGAFSETAMTKIVIPDGCEKIGDYCFGECENLKDVFVPASVNEIGSEAFLCRSISTIHTVKGSFTDKYAEEECLLCDYANEEEVEEKAARQKELEELIASYK